MTAQTTLTVAAGSTVIGFGCGIIFVSYAGIQELLPNKWRGAGIGFTEVCMTIPWAVSGVLIATSLNANTAAGWRWCYYLGLSFGVLSMIGTILFYFPPARPQHDFEKTRWQEIKEIDYVGCALYTAGLTIFLIGLTWAGQPAHPWKSASVLAPIIVGFALLVACFVYDFTVPSQPFFLYRCSDKSESTQCCSWSFLWLVWCSTAWLDCYHRARSTCSPKILSKLA